MNDIAKLTTAYFQPQAGYFWRWAEKGEVIEWQNGETICYRDDLIQLLQALCSQGLPSMGTVLLCLAACQDRWQQRAGADVLATVLQQLLDNESEAPRKLLADYLQRSLQFMDMINGLEAKHRSGNKRVHLLQELFSAAEHKIQAKLAKAMLEVFQGGDLDEIIFQQQASFKSKRFQLDLGSLVQAATVFYNENKLELQLRIGLTMLPGALDLEIPEESKNGGLLEELSQDKQTAGIAQLAKQLVAAINIPMHLQGSSEQALGGVSDISNRGNFDKLLLSELAHDDISLTARLVNNEALYYHHEAPPAPLNQHRVILLDSTIKMWGFPKAYATAAALACSQPSKQQLQIEAFALAGKHHQEIDLQSKEGVIKAMEYLDPSIDCCNALCAILAKQGQRTNTECILICNEDLLKSPAYYAQLSTIQQQLDFLISANRDGQLQFYQCLNGSRKLIVSTKVDLYQLLHTPVRVNPIDKGVLKDLPHFYSVYPWPIYLPTIEMRPRRRNVFYIKDHGLIGISNLQQLLYWPSDKKGAIELLEQIEYAKRYFFGIEYPNLFILVDVDKSEQTKLYQIDLELQTVSCSFYDKIKYITEVVYENYHFIIQTSYKVYKLNCTKQSVESDSITRVDFQRIYHQSKSKHLDFNSIKEHINNGYSTIKRVPYLYVNSNRRLVLGKRELRLTENRQSIILAPMEKKGRLANSPTPEFPMLFTSPGNASMTFSKAKWPNGSEVIIDPRGLVHLQSSHPDIPAITITLVLGKGLGCWSSDGIYSGPSYFKKKDADRNKQLIGPANFYDLYIRRFINALQ